MHIDFSDADLTPLVEQVVVKVVEKLDRTAADDRLAYSEAEAAELLGVKRHQLRDCRLRGEIHARRVGRGYRYLRAELIKWLSQQEQE